MTRKLKRLSVSVAAGLVLAGMLAPGILVSQEKLPSTNSPISLHRVTAGEPGYTPSVGTIFRVTNHTDNSVVASFAAVEVKAGSNWICQLSPRGPLLFPAPSRSVSIAGRTNVFTADSTKTELNPHEAAYVAIQFTGWPSASNPMPGDRTDWANQPDPSGPTRRPLVLQPFPMGINHLSGQPTGAVWRLCLSVQQKKSGIAETSAQITRYPDTLRRRTEARAAGAANLPLNPFAYSYYGKSTGVTGPEVPNE